MVAIVLDRQEREDKIKKWLDEMLDASMEGDYKRVKKLAVQIRKLTIMERQKIVN